MSSSGMARIATLAPCIALFVCGWALYEARTLEPLTMDGVTADAFEGAWPEPSRAPVSTARTIAAAVARAPFQLTRTPPAQPYRLTDGAPAPVPSAAPAPVRFTAVFLMGSAVFDDGRAIAALGWPGRDPRVVHIGDSYEGFRVKSITREGVTLVGADTTLFLRSAAGSSTGNQP